MPAWSFIACCRPRSRSRAGAVVVATLAGGPLGPLGCGPSSPEATVVPPTVPDATVVPPTVDASTAQVVVTPDGGSECLLDDAFLASRKTCSIDADCEVFRYRPTCCLEESVVALAADRVEEAQACADTKPVTCGKCDGSPDRAEDGRVVNEQSTVALQCVEGRCESRITERTCGQTVCKSDELCVSFEGLRSQPDPGGESTDNAYVTFRCEPNPCSGWLDCSCAQALCDAPGDRTRVCEFELNTMSDVVCVPYGD